jgi:hypothetical protein
MAADEAIAKLRAKYDKDAYLSMFNQPFYLEDKYGVNKAVSGIPKTFCPPYQVKRLRWHRPLTAAELAYPTIPMASDAITGFVVLGKDDCNVDGVKMSRLMKEDVFPTEQEAWDDVVLKLQFHKDRNGGGPAYVQLPPIKDKAAEKKLQRETRAEKAASLENANTLRDLCEKNLSDENEGLSEEQLKRLTTFLDKWIEKLEAETPEEESEENEDE